MPVTAALLALVAASVLAGTPTGDRDQTKLTGYLDRAATTLILYKSKAALKARDMSACMSGTIYPFKKRRMADKFIGKKVFAYGYVVDESYYLEQQGEFGGMTALIQNQCENDKVVTITRLERAP